MSTARHLSEEKRQFVVERINGATKLREGLYRSISSAFMKRFRHGIRRKEVSNIIEEKMLTSTTKSNGCGSFKRRCARNGQTVRRSPGRHPSFCRH